MIDFVLFHRNIAPMLLQILFWPAVAASIYYGIWLISEGHTIGWVPLIVGTLFVRVIFEVMIMSFRKYETLLAILSVLEKTKELSK